MDQPRAEPDRPNRPVVVIVFTALLLIVAALSVVAVGRGGLRWPVLVLVAAVVCVITAQGVWWLREWARWVAIFVLVVGMVVIALGVPNYWSHTIVPIAPILDIVCVCPPLVPLGLLIYWFLSNEEYFQ